MTISFLSPMTPSFLSLSLHACQADVTSPDLNPVSTALWNVVTSEVITPSSTSCHTTPHVCVQAFQVDEDSPEYLALHGGNQQAGVSAREQQQRDRALLEEHFDAVEEEEDEDNDDGEGEAGEDGEEGAGDGASDGGEEGDDGEGEGGGMMRKKGTARCVRLSASCMYDERRTLS